MDRSNNPKPWKYCAGVRCSIRSPDREERERQARELITVGVIMAALLTLIVIFGGIALVNLQNIRR